MGGASCLPRGAVHVQRHQALELDGLDLGGDPLDAIGLVHRHRHQRKVLRQRQQAVGAQVVFEPEALDTPHQDARGDLPLAAAVEDHVGEKPAFARGRAHRSRR